MVSVPETCADRGDCLVRKSGRCTSAIILDGQTAYFDDAELAKHFAQSGEAGFEEIVMNWADNRLDICERPDDLKAAAKRARERALKFFHPR